MNAGDLRTRYFVVALSEGQRRLVKVVAAVRPASRFEPRKWRCVEVVAGGNQIRTPWRLNDSLLRIAPEVFASTDPALAGVPFDDWAAFEAAKTGGLL